MCKSFVKISIYLLIIFAPILLYSIIIDDFDRSSPVDYYSTEGTKSKLELSFDSVEKFEGEGSMKISRIIPKDGTWAAYNAFYHHFGVDLLQNWTSGEYFVLWMKDISNNVDSRIILKLNDNDEEWQCQREIRRPGWRQYVFKIKPATGPNPDYQLDTDGFYVPSWFKEAPGYHGNEILNMDTIFGYVFIFTGPNEIMGDIYIDNFKLVNGYEYTIPAKDSVISKDLNEVRIIFGPRVDRNTLNNIKINGINMVDITYYSNINTAVCKLPFSLMDNNTYTISIPSIKLNTDYSMFMDAYQFNFMTGETAIIGKNSVYRTVQLTDGTSLYIPPGAIDSDATFSITKLANIDMEKTYNKFLKGSGIYYKFEPANIILSKSCRITIFYDENKISSEKKLKIYHLGEKGWESFGGEVNSEGNYITTWVNQLGIFTVMEDNYSFLELGDIQKPSSNPFTPNGDGINDTIKFRFTVYKDNCTIDLIIYNTYGYKVREIAKDKKVSIGGNIEVWDGRDDTLQFVPTGIYIYELKIKDPQDKNNVSIQRGAISLIRN